jgi:hypothetical protein
LMNSKWNTLISRLEQRVSSLKSLLEKRNI